MDHPGTAFMIGVSGEGLFGLGDADDWAQYERDGSGRLASNIVEAGGFFRTSPDEPIPDVQIIVAPAMIARAGVGAVTLRSPTPLAKPRIVHNHFETEHDRRVQMAGMRIAMEIAEHSPLK